MKEGATLQSLGVWQTLPRDVQRSILLAAVARSSYGRQAILQSMCLVCREWRRMLLDGAEEHAATLMATYGLNQAIRIAAARADLDVLAALLKAHEPAVTTTVTVAGALTPVILGNTQPHWRVYYGRWGVGAEYSRVLRTEEQKLTVLRMMLSWLSERAGLNDADDAIVSQHVEEAYIASCGRGYEQVVRACLAVHPRHAPRADCKSGEAMVMAAVHGRGDIVRLLLALPEHAPRADCQGGEALVLAAQHGHEDIVRLLLSQTTHAPRPDCQRGNALVMAASNGHDVIVQILLSWPKHAARADSAGFRELGHALVAAATNAHVSTMKLLLSWPLHAPCADCAKGAALIEAARAGSVDAVQLLLTQRRHAPRADVQDGEALVAAASGMPTARSNGDVLETRSTEGHVAAMRLLMSQPTHAPRADCQNGAALLQAARRGHVDAAKLLLSWPEHAPRADCGRSQALRLALQNYQYDMALLLLQWPAHPARLDHISVHVVRHALDAVEHACPQFVEVLRQSGLYPAKWFVGWS